jgi:hypothetical protein
MRALIFRSPIGLGLAAFAAGLIVKWTLHAEFSVGGTMIVVLWLLPLLATYADVLPRRLGRESHKWQFFFSRENWIEILAVLALPGIGFAVDMAAPTLSTATFAAIGFGGVVACIQLVRIERKRRAAGHAL